MVRVYNISTKKPTAPTFVIMTMPLVIITMVFMFGLSVWRGVVSGIGDISFVIPMIVGISLMLYGIFCDGYFNYYEDGKIEIKNDYVIWSYHLNSNIVSSSDRSVTITINDITKLKIKKSQVIVWGRITKKAPFKKQSNIDKCTISVDCSDRDNIIESIKSLVKEM